jgi:hypothetical protein
MKLTDIIIARAIQNSIQDARRICIGACGIDDLGDTVVPSAELVDLSNNKLNNICKLYEQFPCAWWIYLSANNV